jgi:DNA-directed RNA polymerase specialized sigma24 family protein
MTDHSKISELIERSSLGTAGARSLRDRTPPDIAQRIVDLAAEHECARNQVRTTLHSDTDLLLEGVPDSDPAAWNEIVRRYGGLVSATVQSFRLQDADALNAVQMTWLQLAKNIHRIQHPERLGGWLTTTARRECLHILHRPPQHVSQPRGEATATESDPPVGFEQHVLDADAALRFKGPPVRAKIKKIDRAAVLRNLQKIEEDDYDGFVLLVKAARNRNLAFNPDLPVWGEAQRMGIIVNCNCGGVPELDEAMREFMRDRNNVDGSDRHPFVTGRH